MSYPQQPWGPPQWPQQPPPGWGQPPPRRPTSSSATILAILGIGALCGVCGIAKASRPSRSVAVDPVEGARPALPPTDAAPPEDASAQDQLARLPLQERMNVLAATQSIFDRSIERAAATGNPPMNATYVTPRCSNSWLRRFARQRSYDGKDVAQALRDHGFVAVRCIARMEEGAEMPTLPL